ncbi:MAG: hypothetical protein U0527_02500 [Candidatus Eisenbacteria bacterium]
MRAFTGFLCTFGVLIAAAGCSVPDRQQSSVVGITVPATSSVYSATIGSAGGTLTGDLCILTVPAGALSQPTTITMTTSLVNGRAYAEFSPAVTFAVPAQFKLQRPVNASPGQIFAAERWDPATSAWLPIGTPSDAPWVDGMTEPLNPVHLLD